MKDFNEFVEYNKPLKRFMDRISESDGIMLELMFYEFAKQQTAKVKGASLPKQEVRPDCGDRGWLYDNNGRKTGICVCHY